MSAGLGVWKECLKHLHECQDGVDRKQAAALLVARCRQLAQEPPPPKAILKRVVLELQVPFHAAAICHVAAEGEDRWDLVAAAVCLLKAILQAAHDAKVFGTTPPAVQQDTSGSSSSSSNVLSAAMQQQLAAAGLTQVLPELLAVPTSVLTRSHQERKSSSSGSSSSPGSLCSLEASAVTLDLYVLLAQLQQGPQAMLRLHASAGKGAVKLATAAFAHASRFLNTLLQQQQQPEQQAAQQPEQQQARALLMQQVEDAARGIEAVVQAAVRLVNVIGAPIFAFGSIAAVVAAVPPMQQLLCSPRLQFFLALQLAAASQGLLAEQQLQPLRAAAAAAAADAAAEAALNSRGRQLHRTRGRSAPSSGSSGGQPAAGVQPPSDLILLQQLQASAQRPSATPCQQQLLRVLSVDSTTLAWAGLRGCAGTSTQALQQLLALSSVVTVYNCEAHPGPVCLQDEAAPQQLMQVLLQVRLLLPSLLLPCAARFCKPGAAAAATVGLSPSEQAQLCLDIAGASRAAIWGHEVLSSQPSMPSRAPQEWVGELMAHMLLVLHNVLPMLPQQQQQQAPPQLAAAAGAASTAGGCSSSRVQQGGSPAGSTQQGCGQPGAASSSADGSLWLQAAVELLYPLRSLLQYALLLQQPPPPPPQQQQQQGDDQGGADAGSGFDADEYVPPALSLSAQLPVLCTCLDHFVRVQVGAGHAAAAAPLNVSAEQGLRMVAASLEAVYKLAPDFTEDTHGLLPTAALRVGLGHAGGRQFYSLLCSWVKLCAAMPAFGRVGGQWCGFEAASAAMDCLQAPQAAETPAARPDPSAAGQQPAAASGTQDGGAGSPLDALPSLVILGRCCLLWADRLAAVAALQQQQQQQAASGCSTAGSAQPSKGSCAKGQVAAGDAQQPRDQLPAPVDATTAAAAVAASAPQDQQQQVEELVRQVRSRLSSACRMAGPWLARCSAQLPGHDCHSWLQQLEATAAAASEAAADARQVTALVQQLRALGRDSCTFAVPVCCNNPCCTVVSGPTELSLVSGRSVLCAGCRSARYCSPGCQSQHWKQHKPVCKALAAAATAAAVVPATAAE